MDVVFELQGNAFEWSAEKAQSNVRKHGVRFEEAAEAFLDPFHQIGDASRNEEKREFLIGYSKGSRLLLVVYVDHSDTIQERTRIVSARIATTFEKRQYEEN